MDSGRKANPYTMDLDKNPANYQSLSPLTFLERAASTFPKTIAVIHGERRIDYAEFYVRTRRLASALAQRGIGLGAKIKATEANLTRLEESLWYSSPDNIRRAFKRLRVLDLNELTKLTKNPKGLALAAYSNLNGNGPAATNDGWTFRGAGPFQLTGRANFKACGEALARPFEQHPEFIRTPGLDAALSAAWFFTSKGCNAMMASGKIDECSIRINGGTNGLGERRALYGACLEALR